LTEKRTGKNKTKLPEWRRRWRRIPYRAFGWMEMARNFSVVRPRNKTKLTRNGNSGSNNNNNKQ